MFFCPEEYRFSSECVYNTGIGELFKINEWKKYQEIFGPLYDLIIKFMVKFDNYGTVTMGAFGFNNRR